MLQTLKDSLSRLSLSLKDEDDTIITVRECPDTLKDITQLSWPAIEAIMKNGPKAKASRRLFRDLKTSWKEARREKKFDLDRDLGVAPSFDHKGRKVNMKETILLTAWTQSYMGTPKDEINDITRCLSNDTIWPEFKGEDRETAKTIYSGVLSLLESGQVRTFDRPTFQFDPLKKKFVCNSDTNTKELGRQMVDHQHEWWKSKVKSAWDNRRDVDEIALKYWHHD